MLLVLYGKSYLVVQKSVANSAKADAFKRKHFIISIDLASIQADYICEEENSLVACLFIFQSSRNYIKVAIHGSKAYQL